MVITIAIVLICILLAIGVSVPLAFGAVLILLAYTGGYDVAGFFATGHWKMNSVILLAIPLFIMWDGIVSCLRIYNEDELLEMARAADPEGRFDWAVHTIALDPQPVPGIALIGIPRNAP